MNPSTDPWLHSCCLGQSGFKCYKWTGSICHHFGSEHIVKYRYTKIWNTNQPIKAYCRTEMSGSAKSFPDPSLLPLSYPALEKSGNQTNLLHWLGREGKERMNMRNEQLDKKYLQTILFQNSIIVTLRMEGDRLFDFIQITKTSKNGGLGIRMAQKKNNQKQVPQFNQYVIHLQQYQLKFLINLPYSLV